MAKILLIQPHKMLQQAIVLALFPEHHVKVSEKIPEAEPGGEVDLVIIDHAALRERDAAVTGDFRAVESWRLPVILIGAAALDDKATSKKRRQLNMPFQRDDLRTAVADSLGSGDQRRSRSRKPPLLSSASPVPAMGKTSAAESGGIIPDNGKEVIELTDVFEEAPAHDNSEMEASNKA